MLKIDFNYCRWTYITSKTSSSILEFLCLRETIHLRWFSSHVSFCTWVSNLIWVYRPYFLQRSSSMLRFLVWKHSCTTILYQEQDQVHLSINLYYGNRLSCVHLFTWVQFKRKAVQVTHYITSTSGIGVREPCAADIRVTIKYCKGCQTQLLL